MSSTVISGLGVRRGVADRLLDHHRAYYRPRSVNPLPPSPAAPAWPAAASRRLPAAGTPGAARGGLRRVLVLRAVACLVVWATAGAVYGVCQLGDALVPSNDQKGAVICGTAGHVGSVPGC